jgi:tetratricopeptide (TPR) repeat protein
VRAAELKPGEKSYAREIQNAFEALAETALKSGNRAQAAEWFSLLLERAPDHRRANLYQGLALSQNKDCGGAAPLLRKGLAQSAEPAEVQAEGWRELGKCEAAAGGKEAGKAFKKALSLNPKDAEALAGSLALAQSGRKEDLPEIYAAALRADSGNAEALAGLADLRLAAGAHAEAAVLLRRLAGLRPDDPALHSDLGKALLASGREADARDAFARAFELGGRRPDMVENLVRLHRKSGTLREALPALEEWLRQNPENPEAATWSAELAEARKDWKTAEDMWARAWGADSDRADALTGLARATLKRGDGERTIEILEPNASRLGAEAWLLLGEAYALTSQDDKAMETFRKARTGKDAGRAAAGEILVQLAGKRIREARNLFEANSALADDPEMGKARVRLLLLQHEPEKALALAKGLAGKNPSDAEIQVLLGEAFLAKRDGAAALAAFEAAEKSDSSLFRARYGKGMALLLLNRSSEAGAAFFSLGDKSDRRARSLGVWGLGESARKRLREAEAKEYWRQAVSLFPTAQGFADLAALCLRIRQVDEAEMFAQSALEMKEDFPDAAAALADAMLLRSQAKDAGEYLEETLRKQPGSCELQLALCRVRLAGNESQAALTAAEEAKRLCPDSPLPWLYAGLAAVKSGKTKDAAAHFARYRQAGGDPGLIPSGF